MSLTYQTEYFKSSLVTSSYENALRITGPLWWETPHKVPIIRCSVLLVPQAVEQQIELPVIWDAMTGMCRHCDVILDENIKPWTFWIFWEYIYVYIYAVVLIWFLHTHDDVIKWKHFPRYWPFVCGIHRSPVNSPHKGQWREALMFSLICARINGRVNNRQAGDLRRHRAIMTPL